jgi:hypothetical protein
MVAALIVCVCEYVSLKVNGAESVPAQRSTEWVFGDRALLIYAVHDRRELVQRLYVYGSRNGVIVIVERGTMPYDFFFLHCMGWPGSIWFGHSVVVKPPFYPGPALSHLPLHGAGWEGGSLSIQWGGAQS